MSSSRFRETSWCQEFDSDSAFCASGYRKTNFSEYVECSDYSSSMDACNEVRLSGCAWHMAYDDHGWRRGHCPLTDELGNQIMASEYWRCTDPHTGENRWQPDPTYPDECRMHGLYTCCVPDENVASDDVLRDRFNEILGAYGAQLTSLAGRIAIP